MTEGQIETRAGYTGPRPGERVYSHQVAGFPVGTVLARMKDPGVRWQKGNDEGTLTPGWSWYSPVDGCLITDERMMERVSSYNTVVESLPGVLGETTEQYAWRFRDVAILGSERSFGEPSQALKVLDEMGLVFKPSPGLRIINSYDRRHLPRGTRVYVGTAGDPSVWVKTGSGSMWEHVSGSSNYNPKYADAVTVQSLVRDGVEVTEPDPWVAATPGPDEAQRLAEFRATAWQFAYAEKVRRRWCREFERAMLRVGLSEEVAVEPYLNGHRIGDVVTPEQAAQLRVGTFLSTPDAAGATGFAVYERVKRSTNRFGLRRIAAWNVTGHFAKQMVVRGIRSEAQSVEQVSFRCWSAELMQAVPVGTAISDSAEGSRFIKMVQPTRLGDACWGPAQNYGTAAEKVVDNYPRYNHAAFLPGNSSGYRFVRFGPRTPEKEGKE